MVQPAPGAWLPAPLGEKFDCLRRGGRAGLQRSSRDRCRHRRRSADPRNHFRIAANPGSEARSARFHGHSFKIRLAKCEPTARCRLVEILARGTQTVMPPSVHPDTGQPYIWLDPEALSVFEFVALDRAPRLDHLPTLGRPMRSAYAPLLTVSWGAPSTIGGHSVRQSHHSSTSMSVRPTSLCRGNSHAQVGGTRYNGKKFRPKPRSLRPSLSRRALGARRYYLG